MESLEFALNIMKTKNDELCKSEYIRKEIIVIWFLITTLKCQGLICGSQWTRICDSDFE